ncbi:MAG TPA: hypothetical protein VIG78_04170 [Gemmatimonadaceae bacterium]|jgi:hypothetical protein
MRLTTMMGLVLGALTACGRGSADARAPSPPASTSVGVSAIQPVTAGAAASSTTKIECPRTGQWATCSIEKRLIQAGFVLVPIKDRPVKRAGFSVLPSAYQLGKSRLEVFLYPNPAAAAHDVAGLDTLTGSPRGSRGMWGASPTFVRSANLIAILLTDSQAKADRLSLALTAGAPQP